MILQRGLIVLELHYTSLFSLIFQALMFLSTSVTMPYLNACYCVFTCFWLFEFLVPVLSCGRSGMVYRDHHMERHFRFLVNKTAFLSPPPQKKKKG